ncbi:trypsin-like serine protease [Roseibium alexandrii]|uniref:trypsin-like serine protease n=1 Tax=Roseibium alexandrii TaxID=388408 RepID=UPI003750F673
MSFEANDDSYPGQAVAFIVATWGSQSFVSSGVLVGRNDVLTASHSIYDTTLGGLADEVKIYFSYDPDEPNPTFYTPAYYNYYTDFDPDNDGLIYSGDNQAFTLGGAEKDIALLSLSEAAGDIYGWFGINYSYTGGNVSVLGFPGRYDNNLTFDSGYAYKDVVDNYVDTGFLEINSGNSGGPIFTGSGSDVSVVGIVSTSAAAASVTGHENWLTSNIASNDVYMDTTTTTTPVVTTVENAIYRFFNTDTGTHFYTASSAERDTVIANASSFSYEGVAFLSANSSTDLSSLVNVYRFYNTQTGTHFYTSSEAEREDVTNNNAAFVYEGIAYQAYAGDTASNTALYRFFNTETGNHFYTAVDAERDSVQTMGQFSYEGIAYYVDIA